MITNHEWLVRNSLRSYPVTEDANAVSNLGWALDPALITDIIIVGDRSGGVACVQSVLVTPGACSVVIGDQESGESLCVASVPSGFVGAVSLVPVGDGIAGSISFGPAMLLERHSTIPRGLHRFDGATIEARCVVFHGAMPVTSLSVPYGVKNRGDVLIEPGDGLTIVAEIGEDDGDPETRFIFSLKNPSGFLSPCEEKSTPCGCLGVPIKTINGVPGNDDGIIFIEIEDANGAVSLLSSNTLSLLIARPADSFCSKAEEPDVYGRIKSPSGDFSLDDKPETDYQQEGDVTFPTPAI